MKEKQQPKRVTLFGGTSNKNYSQKIKDDCARLGAFIAKSKAELLTGACYGFPYFTAKGAIGAGGKVIGYSPAQNVKEHVENYKFPLDGCTKIVYQEQPDSPFLKRSMDMMPLSDIVVGIGGSWGTYLQLMSGVFYKKIIIVITEFGGAAERFVDTFYYFGGLDYNANVQNGMIVIPVRTVDDAMERLNLFLK